MILDRLKKAGIPVVLYFAFIISSLANPPDSKDGQITGAVFDNQSKHTVEYATVALYDIKGRLITGTVTNTAGLFSIEEISYGTYSITVSFLGY